MLGRVTIGHSVQWTPTARSLGHPWKSLDNTSVAMMMMIVTMVIGGGSYENSDDVGGDLDCDDDDNDILDM